MAKDLNQCNFIGRTGAEPEMRYTSSGKAVANFTIAVNDEYKKESGEKTKSTEWVRCVAWGKLAEIVGEYVHKGDLVFVSGQQKTRSWEDGDGNKRYTTEIVAKNMQMLGSKDDAKSKQEEIFPDIPDEEIPF